MTHPRASEDHGVVLEGHRARRFASRAAVEDELESTGTGCARGVFGERVREEVAEVLRGELDDGVAGGDAAELHEPVGEEGALVDGDLADGEAKGPAGEVAAGSPVAARDDDAVHLAAEEAEHLGVDGGVDRGVRREVGLEREFGDGAQEVAGEVGRGRERVERARRDGVADVGGVARG